jgi:hypothetical protein
LANDKNVYAVGERFVFIVTKTASVGNFSVIGNSKLLVAEKSRDRISELIFMDCRTGELANEENRRISKHGDSAASRRAKRKIICSAKNLKSFFQRIEPLTYLLPFC